MDGIDWGSLGLGGGVFSALAVIVVTLIKARSSDRTNILTQQAIHMDRLGKERNEAIVDRDKAWDDAEKWRTKYEQEIRARITAETAAATSAAATDALERQIAELTRQVQELRTQVSSLGGTS